MRRQLLWDYRVSKWAEHCVFWRHVIPVRDFVLTVHGKDLVVVGVPPTTRFCLVLRTTGSDGAPHSDWLSVLV